GLHAVVEVQCWVDRWLKVCKIPSHDGLAAIDRVVYGTDLSVLADCDFVIEAIPEKLDLQQQVFAELDAAEKADAIFASNTRGFVIAEVGRDVSEARKPLFVGMHFSNPVTTMRMCEVIYTPETSQDTIDATVKLAEAGGKVVSMVKDTPGTYGFLLNR